MKVEQVIKNVFNDVLMKGVGAYKNSNPQNQLLQKFENIRELNRAKQGIGNDEVLRVYYGQRDKPVIVLVSGHKQDHDTPGSINELSRKFREQGYTVVHATVGKLKDDLKSHFLLGRSPQNTEVVFQRTLAEVKKVLNQTGKNEVAIVGYSWGGGTGEKLSSELRKTGVNVKASASIDAIKLGAKNIAEPVKQAFSSNHKNYFQTNSVLQGSLQSGANNIQLNNENHKSIDSNRNIALDIYNHIK